jgi:hypothetical protein
MAKGLSVVVNPSGAAAGWAGGACDSAATLAPVCGLRDRATSASAGSPPASRREEALDTGVTASSVSAPPLLERLSAEIATALPRSQSPCSTLPFSETAGLRAVLRRLLPKPRPGLGGGGRAGEGESELRARPALRAGLCCCCCCCCWRCCRVGAEPAGGLGPLLPRPRPRPAAWPFAGALAPLAGVVPLVCAAGRPLPATVALAAGSGWCTATVGSSSAGACASSCGDFGSESSRGAFGALLSGTTLDVILMRCRKPMVERCGGGHNLRRRVAATARLPLACSIA